MLTKTSLECIRNLLGSTDVKDHVANPALTELFKKLHQQRHSYTIVHRNDKRKTGKYPASNFMAKRLMKKILKRRHVYSISWTLTQKSNDISVKCSLNIYYANDEELISRNKIDMFVDAISFVASFSNKDRDLTIHLALLNDKKRFRKHLTALHVNSGSCYFTDTVADVCVFRLEECLKVLFHECIHALRFSKIGLCRTVDDVYCERYNLNSKNILLDETYTEIWARLLNCYYISQLGSGDDLQKFCSCVALEKIFSLYQANKIIMPQSTKKTMKRVLPRKNLDKDTNVTAYYLGTAEVFQHLNEFLEFTGCEPYLKDTIGFHEFMKGECQRIPKMKVDPKDPMYKTMRMTVIELEI